MYIGTRLDLGLMLQHLIDQELVDTNRLRFHWIFCLFRLQSKLVYG